MSPDSLALALKRILEGNTVSGVQITTHYGNMPVEAVEVWMQGSELRISVMAEVPEFLKPTP